ncbi:MAG: N-acetylmuramoyl-L-alanine amidase [bacterium]
MCFNLVTESRKVFSRNISKLCILILLSVLWSTTHIVAEKEVADQESKTISINFKKQHQKITVITRHNQSYISIPDLSELLAAKHKKLRRSLAHEVILQYPELRCLFLEKSREWWILDQRHFFNNPTHIYKGQLYIPVKECLKSLGYSVHEEEEGLIIQENKIKTQEIAQSRLQLTHPQIVTSKDYAKPILDMTATLPEFRKDKTLFISFQGMSYPLKHFFYSQDKVLYVYLENTFKKEGYTCKETKDSYSLQKENTHYIFSKKHNKITIYIGNKQLQLSGIAAVKKRRNKVYIPFENIISALDYGVIYQKKSNTLVLQAKLQGIFWVNQGPFPVLKLLSAHKLYCSAAQEGSLKEGYFITLANTVLATEKIRSKSPHPFLKWNWAYKKGADTRLFLRAGLESNPPTILRTKKGTELRFHSILLTAKEQLKHNRLQFKITGTRPFKAKSQVSKSGAKLIIDIPNTFSELPLLLRSNYGVYKQVRMSQLQVDPPMTRIEFNFEKNQKHTWKLTQEGQALVVNFPLTSVEKKIVKKTYKKKTEKKGRQKGLANKVIVLDPGHGGRDPGAIGLNKEYEKRYTLDVVQRLKRNLEAQGAYVILTRSSDHSISLPKRIRLANHKRADLFISVHFNSFKHNKVKGTETYYYKHKDRYAAKILHQAMVRALNLKDNGLRRKRLYVLRHTRMPAVLLEPAYMTERKNLEKIKMATFRQNLADTLSKGITRYFNR